MIELQTDRLAFRQWNETDFEEVASFFSIKENTHFLGGTKTKEEAWRLIASYIGHNQLKGYSYVAIEEKASKKLVGSVGLWNSTPWPELELGYWIFKDMQNKGFATEAAKATRDFAFNQLKTKSLVSYISDKNEASIKVAKQLGANYDSTIKLLNFGPHEVYRY